MKTPPTVLLEPRRMSKQQGHLGLPPGRVDAYVLATHLAPDAVVARHAALQYPGKAHSV
jgi:hypothetical protein